MKVLTLSLLLGIPKREPCGDGETWNGVYVSERLETYRARLPRPSEEEEEV